MLQLKPAFFSQDYLDNTNPEYKGYYPTDQDTAPFKTPYFEYHVVNEIVKEQNMLAKKYPEAGYDVFKWDGDVLIWLQYDVEVPILIHPLQVRSIVDSHIINVYPIGHGSWNWECKPIQ